MSARRKYEEAYEELPEDAKTTLKKFGIDKNKPEVLKALIDSNSNIEE